MYVALFLLSDTRKVVLLLSGQFAARQNAAIAKRTNLQEYWVKRVVHAFGQASAKLTLPDHNISPLGYCLSLLTSSTTFTLTGLVLAH
jgi:hypothetical protein